MKLQRRLAGFYLAFQGTAAVGWWAFLVFIPSTRTPFTDPSAPDSSLLALWLADAVIFIVGSFVASFGVLMTRRWEGPVLCLVAGGVSYAALYCLGLSLLTGTAWAGTLFMLPSMTITVCIAWYFRPREKR